MPHTLYIVGTPLGNAADWSLRAQQVLAATPVIAAEDTRVTARLLAHCGISGPRLLTYTDAFAPKKAQRQAEVLAALQAGDVALVSDAGPEMDAALAALARQHNVQILAPSGPSALSGCSTC